MRSNVDNTRSISLRLLLILTIAVVAVPLLVAVALFGVSTVRNQQATLLQARRASLAIYAGQMEDVLQSVERYTADIVANNHSFLSVVYAKTHTEAHTRAYDLVVQAETLARGSPFITGFYIYSDSLGYYQQNYTVTYPQQDLAAIKAIIKEAANLPKSPAGWRAVELSVGTVFLNVHSINGTVFGMLVDPAQQDIIDLPEDHRIFYQGSDGREYTPKMGFGVSGILPLAGENAVRWTFPDTGETYDLTGIPLEKYGYRIVYASPAQSYMEQLDFTQRALLLVTVGLVACIPLSWLLMSRFFLLPLHRLAYTAREIQKGNTEIRVREDSRMEEAKAITCTVNVMLDTIRQQKIDSYEQRLMTQRAQLQYLQMQIRPHFFLSCMNVIYSLAGEQKYRTLQQLTLDLSVYLRNIFKDGSQLIPLETELDSVSSYLRIIGQGSVLPPELQLEIVGDAACVPVPPLCVLTFVENSVKHSRLVDTHLHVRVVCQRICSIEGDYLDVTVRDNGGGIPQETLTQLTGGAEPVYQDKHVGISNIRHRLWLMYGDKATLSFRNLTDGACVELFIPIRMDDKEVPYT